MLSDWCDCEDIRQEEGVLLFAMLFFSFFKSLVGKTVVVELKNDLSICGTLHSVDQFLNIKLSDITVTDPDRQQHTQLTYLFMTFYK